MTPKRYLPPIMVMAVVVPLLLFVLMVAPVAAEVATTRSTTSVNSLPTSSLKFADIKSKVEELQQRDLLSLPTNFYDDRCHPCLARDEYMVQVYGINTPNWLEIQSAMEQASRDTKIALEFHVYPNTASGVQEMTNAIRTQTEYQNLLKGEGDEEALATKTGDTNEDDEEEDRTRMMNHQAIVVTIPDGLDAGTTQALEDAIRDALQSGLPVFGHGEGYQKADDLGLLGYIAQDEFVAGQVVANQVIDRINAKYTKQFEIPYDERRLEDETPEAEPEAESEPSTLQHINWTHTSKALYVTTATNAASNKVQERYRGIQNAFEETYGSSMIYNTTVSSVEVQIEYQLEGATIDSSSSESSTFEAMSPATILEGCQYEILILDGGTDESLTNTIMEALESSICLNQTLVTVFSESSTITPATRQRLLEDSIDFVSKPQLYLQSVFAVLMASIYTSTGKKLALPSDSEGVFLSGPQILEPDVKRNKLPEDSITNCEAYAFPICNPETADKENTLLEAHQTPIFSDPPVLPGSDRRVCNEQGCIERRKLRLAGAIHGTSTSLFWKPIYASAKQTALDLGIELEMEPMEPKLDRDVFWKKMNFRIRSFCESGVDGIIVSLPNEALLDAVRFCQDLLVPVVSINSGAQFAKELGIMAHIGQMEYNAGYGGGKRLIEAGMKEGYCLNHNPGSVALLDRCLGFEAAINEAPADKGVVYRGMVEVSGDDETRTKVNMETAISDWSGADVLDSTWEGIGFLTLSTSSVDAVLRILEDHPDAMVGTFDVGERIYGPVGDGRLMFGIDQQPLLQGIMPVYLLAYAAYTRQSLRSKVIETGPHFLDVEPSEGQEICENNYFAVCPEIPEEEMNELPRAVVAIGYFMVALTLFSCVVCVAWLLHYQSRSELIRVSQPPFLIALVVGIAISSLSILFMSVETDYPTLKSEFTGLLTEEENPDIKKANASCMAVYWLQGVGNAIAFVSLFSKIWKIQLIYKAGEKFRRIEVGVIDIAPYAAVLMTVVLGILIAWQVTDPFIWTRTVELEDDDGLALESYGSCSSDKGWYFLISLLCFQLVYLMYALVLCWQTKDIPSDFAESNWVSLCVICIFQVSILAIPLGAMVRDSSTAFYFVRACAVFLQNFTVLCLMFIPKMWRVARGEDRLSLVRPNSVPSSSYHQSDYRQSGKSKYNDGSNQFGASAVPSVYQSSAEFTKGGDWRRNSNKSIRQLREECSATEASRTTANPSSAYQPSSVASEAVLTPESEAVMTEENAIPTNPIEAEVSLARVESSPQSPETESNEQETQSARGDEQQ